MKLLSAVTLMLIMACACISNPLDSKQENHIERDSPLRALLTKPGTVSLQEDSLTIMSKIQKDVDNLMMNRILLKDSIYVLAIKRQDAIFLGVSEDVYDRYVEYVTRLNGKLYSSPCWIELTSIVVWQIKVLTLQKIQVL